MIELENLQKVIGQDLLVDIERLTVQAGEIAALVSPAGGEKTHLLDLLTGKSRPTVGTIRIAEIDPHASQEAFSHRVGVVFTEDSLYKHRSPLANLTFHCQLHGLPRSVARETLTRVGLADHADAKTEKLAPGLARRLAFGRAILHAPQVLLLVDPLARCDEASISLLSRLMRELAEQGTTLLILADGTAHLAALCDVIYTMNRGKIVEVYKPQEDQDIKLPFKIPVRMEDRIVLVNPVDILFVEAQDGRAFLKTAGDRLPTQFTLTELEERLSRSGFFRAHRGYLVNLQHVIEVIPYTRNTFSLHLDDPADTEIPLSKSAAVELRELLGY
ncbi:MAG: LytTR family transcriptional regulator DNA-binding domain-containing protein [Anaerolineae bacterium]|nr:LytTR family transcriptional regulator DNA-binding domain-containing protein [Anaerolineae bacterium]